MAIRAVPADPKRGIVMDEVKEPGSGLRHCPVTLRRGFPADSE